MQAKITQNQFNEVKSTRPKNSLNVVAIGASAGGLNAIREYLDSLTNNESYCTIIAQHLPPDHNTLTPKLLSNMYKHIKIRLLENGMKIEPNCVYFQPSGVSTHIREDHTIQLESLHPTERCHVIEILLDNISKCSTLNSTAVVLSGVGSDGCESLKNISHSGGLVLAQKPESADFDTMPLNAIKTTYVDFVCRPGAMPDLIRNHFSQKEVVTFETKEVNFQTETIEAGKDENLELKLSFELDQAKKTIEIITDQLEKASEEVQLQNEHLMSSNEELQTTNEELQTVNEELYTVNSEYHEKMAQFGAELEEKDEIIAKYPQPALVLDGNDKIVSFSNEAKALFGLMSKDIGRSILDFKHALLSDQLFSEIRQIFNTASSQSEILQNSSEKSYHCQIQKVRFENSLKEVVILTFLDVSKYLKLNDNLGRNVNYSQIRHSNESECHSDSQYVQ